MGAQLYKLRPDRDLQCYFERPSAAAALSQAGENTFTLSGCWRQQFDWAVVEWNRDNVFEHPALRNLPDGDLSGLELSYQEVRTNCVPLDSNLYPTVEWPYLRIWAETGDTEALYEVPLKDHATAVSGAYVQATATFQLQGTPTAGDIIDLAWLDVHANYWVTAEDQSLGTLDNAVAQLAVNINTGTATKASVSATAAGTRITLTYLGVLGANGNRIGVYGSVYGAGTENWTPSWSMFSGGTSPQTWQVDLDFSNLSGYKDLDLTQLVTVPTSSIRKMRWTWAADQQTGSFARSEFSVVVSGWTVTGSNLLYSVAGAGSRRIEDDSADTSYAGTWSAANGNYSGGSIRYTTVPGSSVQCTYTATSEHSLYLGTRRADSGSRITIQVDANTALTPDLKLAGEDVLVRLLLGRFSGQTPHSVTITHAGAAGECLYFDFLEIATAATELPTFDTDTTTSLATDWDTDHSIALPPERTAWLIETLGFLGRVNHYAGALWFYELVRQGHQYAAGSVVFSGAPEFGKTTQISLGGVSIEHLNLISDTGATIARCFELLIRAGSSSVWAQADGATLKITARVPGTDGNAIALSANTNSQAFTASASGTTLTGGVDGKWVTDLSAAPRLNRAARDWNRAYFQALKAKGIDVVASFSMELQHGDDGTSAGIAQRYPDGSAVWLNTPALQTNFGPASTAFWQQAYLDMAGLMSDAGVTPYLQFGEVQWWYFASSAGMPFYDAYTTSAFQAAYDRPLTVIASQNADPSPLAQECAFLAQLVGEFTKTIMELVRESYAGALFEVLYAPDVNDTSLNQLVNLPKAYWTPANLACFKTENFTYTGDRDLDKARESVQLPMQLGFAESQASHLVGISDYTTPWQKEQVLAHSAGLKCVVLFALDQLCLIGYELPIKRRAGRSRYLGG